MRERVARKFPVWLSKDLQLLGLVPLVCVAAAAMGWFIPHTWKIELIAFSAWGITLLLMSATVALAWRVYRGRIHELGWRGVRRHIPALLFCGTIILLYNQLDHHANKVVQDELIIQSSALQLLENNEYRFPQFSHNLLSDFSLYSGNPDKRPPLFPVLLSLVHRLLGYETNNGFLLNSLLGFLLLVTVASCGERIIPRWGTYLFPAALASLPLLSQNVTSQHLEVLYLFLIAALLLLAMRIVQPGGFREVALAYLVASLIAFTRYEGLIFMSVPFFLHLFCLARGRQAAYLGWVVAVLPLAMIFIFAQTGYVFGNPNFWQLDDTGNVIPFGLQYWAWNLGAFLDLMLNLHRVYPGSFPLSIMGLASIPVLIYEARSRIRPQYRQSFLISGSWIPVATMGLCCMGFLALVFSYHWGEMNTHVTARFALFPYLFLALCGLCAIRIHPFATGLFALVMAIGAGVQTFIIDDNPLHFSYILFLVFLIALIVLCLIRRGDAAPLLLTAFWGFFILSETSPAIVQRYYESDYYPIKQTDTFLMWCRENANKNNFYVSDTALYGMLTKQSSSSLKRFLGAPDKIMDAYRKGLYDNVYFMEYGGIDETGRIYPHDDWKLPEEQFPYTVIDTVRFADKVSLRLLRIKPVPDLQKQSSSQ